VSWKPKALEIHFRINVEREGIPFVPANVYTQSSQETEEVCETFVPPSQAPAITPTTPFRTKATRMPGCDEVLPGVLTRKSHTEWESEEASLHIHVQSTRACMIQKKELSTWISFRNETHWDCMYHAKL